MFAFGNARFVDRVVYTPPAPPAGTPYRFILQRTAVAPGWLVAPHHSYPASDIPVRSGTPYYAVIAGTLSRTGGGCGNGAILRGDDGVEYTYCHSSTVTARNGRIAAGAQIGTSGNTGNSTGPHLHFQIRSGGALRCPQNMLFALFEGRPVPAPGSLPTSGRTA